MNYNEFKGAKVLFLSPHYDDIVYSCAITISELLKLNCTLTNINLFTRSKWTVIKSLSDEYSISSLRLQEELTVASNLGFSSLSIGLPDSSINNLDAETELLIECNPILIAQYSTVLKKAIRNLNYDIILVPLGKYGHIDHKYTRSIADTVFKTSCIYYYEDLPYYAHFQDKYYDELLNMENVMFEGDFYKKKALMELYQSQFELKNLWTIHKYGMSIVNGKFMERIWKSR